MLFYVLQRWGYIGSTLPKSRKLLEQLRETQRRLGHRHKTELTYAGWVKAVTPHIFRHTFATELRRQGYEVEQIQKLLGHKKRETTLRYIHGVEIDMSRIVSPLDV